MGVKPFKLLLTSLLFLAVSAPAASAWASANSIVFSGSFSSKDETLTSATLILGEAGGPTGPCTDGTCSTCTGGIESAGFPAPCNENWAPPSGTITFTYSMTTAGFPAAAPASSGTTSTTPLTLVPAQTVSIDANQSISFSIRVSDICNALTGDTTCRKDISGTLNVGVSSNANSAPTDYVAVRVIIVGGDTTTWKGQSSTPCALDTTTLGICDFGLKPGDEKAYVQTQDLATGNASNNMPSALVGTFINRIRFYFITVPNLGDCASASNTLWSNSSQDFRELGIDTTGGTDTFLSQDIIGDLENDKYYCFRAASLDQAGNIGWWTSLPVEADPSLVVGFFTEDKNCFIATAAYGSAMEEHVQTFREFRNRFMLPTKLGRALVNFYYYHAPKWAAFIRQDERFRATARFFLWPVWLAAKLSLEMTWPLALGTLALLLGVFALLRRPRAGKIFFLIFLTLGGLGSARVHAATLDEDDISAEINAASDEDLESEAAADAVDLSAPAPTPKPKATVNKQNADRPPMEAPYPGASDEEDDVPTPLKSPSTRKQAKKKGPTLLRVTKEGEYIYKRKASPQTAASSFRFGTLSLQDAVNPETGLHFDDIYTSSGPVMFFDYEWQFFRHFGKLAFKLGTGLFTVSGKGRFYNTKAEAEERYTFVMFPNNASLVYRLQYWDKQILVPYVEGGGGYYTFAEVRDDFKRTKLGGVSAAQFAVGGAFLLDFLDPAAMVELDEDHGINHLYLTAELRVIKSFKDDFDISGNVFNAGFLFEF